MGTMITLACPFCHLKSDILHVGWGMQAKQYEAAWCPNCKRFCTPLVASYENGIDKPVRPCCPDCQEEVPLFDMENKLCPLCGNMMKEEVIGLWD